MVLWLVIIVFLLIKNFSASILYGQLGIDIGTDVSHMFNVQINIIEI